MRENIRRLGDSKTFYMISWVRYDEKMSKDQSMHHAVQPDLVKFPVKKMSRFLDPVKKSKIYLPGENPKIWLDLVKIRKRKMSLKTFEKNLRVNQRIVGVPVNFKNWIIIWRCEYFKWPSKFLFSFLPGKNLQRIFYSVRMSPVAVRKDR